MKRVCLFDNRIIQQVMSKIISSPRDNSLCAFINSVPQVVCILQGGLQLVLNVAHCIEVQKQPATLSHVVQLTKMSAHVKDGADKHGIVLTDFTIQ